MNVLYVLCAQLTRDLFAIAKFLLTIGRLLLHCWYSLGRPVTIGTPMVLSVFDDWCSVPFVKNSQKTVKQQKMTIGVPIVTCLHRVRRIHKAAQTPLPCETSMIRAWEVATALSRPNSVEYGNSKTTTLLPSAKCTRPLFQGRTGCGGRPSGWHDIVTCQRLVALCYSMQYLLLIMLCRPNFYMCVLRDSTFSCNLHIAAGCFASARH